MLGVEDVSPAGLGGRRRHDLVSPIVGLDLQELFPAKRAGIFGLGPLSNAAETEGVLTSIDLGLGKQGSTQAELSMQIEQLECSIWGWGGLLNIIEFIGNLVKFIIVLSALFTCNIAIK